MMLRVSSRHRGTRFHATRLAGRAHQGRVLIRADAGRNRTGVEGGAVVGDRPQRWW